MSAIGPGSLLLCVRADPNEYAPLPVVGRVYACTRTGEAPEDFCAHCGTRALVSLAELPSEEYGYWACQFAPAGRRGDFESLLKAAKTPQREGADA